MTTNPPTLADDTGWTKACPQCAVRHGLNPFKRGKERDVALVLCKACEGKEPTNKAQKAEIERLRASAAQWDKSIGYKDNLIEQACTEGKLLKAENKALWRVYDAVKADLDSDRKRNALIFSMTDTEWIRSLGDGERKTLEALADVPPRGVKGEGKP